MGRSFRYKREWSIIFSVSVVVIFSWVVSSLLPDHSVSYATSLIEEKFSTPAQMKRTLYELFIQTERIYTNSTMDEILETNVNMTDYRLRFPYPFWWAVNITEDLHSACSGFIAPPHFIIGTVLFALAFTALRWVLDSLVVGWIATKLKIRPEDHVRLQENVAQALYYLVSWSLLTSYLIGTDYLWDTVYLWEGNFPQQPLPLTVYRIYMMNLGWYLHGLYALFSGLEVTKKDFWNMVTHHIVTLMLLYFSIMAGYYRIGTLVLFTHDLCDVFLQLPKILLILRNSGYFLNVSIFAEMSVFLPLPISWIVFRLYLFAKLVIYPALVDCFLLSRWPRCDYWLLFNPLLWVLYGLQLYWFYLIITIALKAMLGNEWADVRDPGKPSGSATASEKKKATREKTGEEKNGRPKERAKKEDLKQAGKERTT